MPGHFPMDSKPEAIVEVRPSVDEEDDMEQATIRDLTLQLAEERRLSKSLGDFLQEERHRRRKAEIRLEKGKHKVVYRAPSPETDSDLEDSHFKDNEDTNDSEACSEPSDESSAWSSDDSDDQNTANAKNWSIACRILQKKLSGERAAHARTRTELARMRSRVTDPLSTPAGPSNARADDIADNHSTPGDHGHWTSRCSLAQLRSRAKELVRVADTRRREATVAVFALKLQALGLRRKLRAETQRAEVAERATQQARSAVDIVRKAHEEACWVNEGLEKQAARDKRQWYEVRDRAERAERANAALTGLAAEWDAERARMAGAAAAKSVEFDMQKATWAWEKAGLVERKEKLEARLRTFVGQMAKLGIVWENQTTNLSRLAQQVRELKLKLEAAEAELNRVRRNTENRDPSSHRGEFDARIDAFRALLPFLGEDRSASVEDANEVQSQNPALVPLPKSTAPDYDQKLLEQVPEESLDRVSSASSNHSHQDDDYGSLVEVPLDASEAEDFVLVKMDQDGERTSDSGWSS